MLTRRRIYATRVTQKEVTNKIDEMLQWHFQWPAKFQHIIETENFVIRNRIQLQTIIDALGDTKEYANQYLSEVLKLNKNTTEMLMNNIYFYKHKLCKTTRHDNPQKLTDEDIEYNESLIEDRSKFVNIFTAISQNKHILKKGRTIQIDVVYLSQQTVCTNNVDLALEQYEHKLSTDDIRNNNHTSGDAIDCIPELFRRFKQMIETNASIQRIVITYNHKSDKVHVFVPKIRVSLPKNPSILEFSGLSWISNSIGVIIPGNPPVLSSNDKGIIIISYHCHSGDKVKEYLHSNGCVTRIRKKDFHEKTEHLFSKNCGEITEQTSDNFDKYYESYPDSDYDKLLEYLQTKKMTYDSSSQKNDCKAPLEKTTVSSPSHANIWTYGKRANVSADCFVIANIDSSWQYNIDVLTKTENATPFATECISAIETNASYVTQLKQLKSQTLKPLCEGNDNEEIDDDGKTDECKNDVCANENNNVTNFDRVVYCLKTKFGATFLNCHSGKNGINPMEINPIMDVKVEVRPMGKMPSGSGLFAEYNVWWAPEQTKAIRAIIMEKMLFLNDKDLYNYMNHTLGLQIVTEQAKECVVFHSKDQFKFYVFNSELSYEMNGIHYDVYGLFVPNQHRQRQEGNWRFVLVDFFISSECIDNNDHGFELPLHSRKMREYRKKISFHNRLEGNNAKLKRELGRTNWKKVRKHHWKPKRGTGRNCEIVNVNINSSDLGEYLCKSNMNANNWIPSLVVKNGFKIARVLITKTSDGLIFGISFEWGASQKQWFVKSISTNICDLVSKWRLADPELNPNDALLRELIGKQENQRNIHINVIRGNNIKRRQYRAKGCGDYHDRNCEYVKYKQNYHSFQVPQNGRYTAVHSNACLQYNAPTIQALQYNAAQSAIGVNNYGPIYDAGLRQIGTYIKCQNGQLMVVSMRINGVPICYVLPCG